ncbi:hypothetical protein KKC97_03035 [bacterium]|nr:hypothetical protein [bacterium]MBU1636619.1 hypothetical protein [bacterium]
MRSGIAKRIRVSMFLVFALICCISCDDDKPAASGPPVEGLVIYRHENERQVRLAWQPAQFVSEYRIMRAYDSRGPYSLIGQSSSTSWSDTDFPASDGEPELVFYRVAGVREDGCLTTMSNTVGYYHFEAYGDEQGHEYATPFGLPFVFWRHDSAGVPIYGRESNKPSDIIRNQANCGDVITADQILKQASGWLAYQDCNGSWMGDLESSETMRPGDAYWYLNRSGSPDEIFLMGEADNWGRYGELFINDPSADVPGTFSTPYSWRISHPVSVHRLGLLEQGFTGGTIEESDKIATQDGSGDFAVYLTESNRWYPEDFQVYPGQAYGIVNNHAGHSWTYEYRP